MKINEVAMREAEPNYEVDPAQARLAAIAVKLMDKAKTTTDENLQLALSRVATHLPEYGTAFGAKNMQELLDIVNGTGRYAPDADMPQDNKNPIKVSKESLMKMMAFGQKMVDKEGTSKPDIAEDTEDREKINAGKMRRRIADIRFMVADMEDQISELVHLDNGDLTDQINTMKKYSDGLYSVLSRAMQIVPVYEDQGDEDYRDGHDINLLKAVARQMADDARNNDYTAIDDLLKNVSESELKGFLSQVESIEEALGARQISQIDKKYEELTDENQHGEAALLLVNAFGDKEELNIINAINARHKKRGSIMRSEQQLRDEIANAHYKTMKQGLFPIGENVITDLFKSTTDEKRQKQRMGSAYDSAMVDKHTKKFEKQGLSAEDARKYAYRKVYGKPLGEGKLSVNKIHKAVDAGKSMDAIVGMFADKGTTNTDDIRKIVKDYKFKSRMKK